MLEGNGAQDIWTHGLKMGFGFEQGALSLTNPSFVHVCLKDKIRYGGFGVFGPRHPHMFEWKMLLSRFLLQIHYIRKVINKR